MTDKITHVVAVLSGKGGVGKSSVAALLAAALRRQGARVGVRCRHYRSQHPQDVRPASTAAGGSGRYASGRDRERYRGNVHQSAAPRRG